MSIRLEHARILTPLEVIEDGVIVINEKGQIDYCGKSSTAPQSDGKRVNLKGRIIIPGFIDLHVHGGLGVTFGMGDLAKDLEKYSRWVASGGVTGYLLSITGPDAESIYDLISAYVKIFEKGIPGATPLGLHLEGPFLNPEKKGAFNPSWLRLPDPDEARKYLELGRGWIKQITIAPELPKATEVATIMRRGGVTVALGHSNTTYEIASQALDEDFTHITHSFNAQSGFSHRAPGVFGALLASNRVTGELIADGVHVHPGAMKVLLRCLGPERITLISDAIPGAGLPDGEYHLIGQHVNVKSGKATLDDGTIAGSTVQMNECVRNMHQLVGAPLLDSVRMASLNPARVIREERNIGSLEAGKWANLVVMDEAVNIQLCMVKGKINFGNL